MIKSEAMQNSKELFAGDNGLKVIIPEIGDIVWTTNANSGKLESIKYEGKIGEKFDQYHYEKWKWLTGPDEGEIEITYGRSFWLEK